MKHHLTCYVSQNEVFALYLQRVVNAKNANLALAASCARSDCGQDLALMDTRGRRAFG
jgi:hypothetical protein